MFAAVSEDDSTRRFDAKRIEEQLSKVATGDTDALAELYGSTKAAIFGFALSFLKNSHDAEDVLHDCYLRIFTQAHTYRAQGNPMAWILTITKNLCLLRMRDSARNAPAETEGYFENESSEEKPQAGASSAAFTGGTPEDRLIIRACMDELSPEEQRIVVLHAVAGLKHRETAELLGIPLSTALSKYNRALEKLRKLLREE